MNFYGNKNTQTQSGKMHNILHQNINVMEV